MSTIKLRIKQEGNLFNVGARIRHPMETGRRLTATTEEVIPAFHITEIVCRLNDAIVMRAYTGAGISTNPYFSFNLSEARVDDVLALSWVDNQGNTDSLKVII